MADEDKESKTEDATDKRLGEMRKEGKIAKSQDVQAVVTLIASGIALFLFMDGISEELQNFYKRALSLQDIRDPGRLLKIMLLSSGMVVLPMMAVAMVAGLSVGVVQTGGLFTLGAMKPKFDFLIKPNFKAVFPSRDSAVELLKSLGKMSALGAVSYGVLSGMAPIFLNLTQLAPALAAAEVGKASLYLALYTCIGLTVIALIDVVWQRWKFKQDSKMSKQEVKDESKQSEGDQTVKNKMRQKMFAKHQARMVASVDDATVLVTNPTHVSIALRYEPDRDGAPVVLGKGVDLIALRMRERARSRGIPIVENRPLARAILATVPEGHPIPCDMYEAVAGIIAHILRLKGELAS